MIGASEWTRTIDPTMSRWCSNQLSYRRIMVRLMDSNQRPHHVKVVL